ncbi:MAG TPA: DUF58 domain-containing protein [Bacillales bacterium]|nr:DUF58 domain-containing protein [Bacillales bacterium]
MSGLLDPAVMTRLSSCKLANKRMIHGSYKGERRSGRIGTSLEFSDYRLYSQGDDPRQIDWNTYARTQKHYIKRFLDEQELTVNVFLDCTKSMSVYEEKWRRALELTAAISLMSLSGSDRVAVFPVSSETRDYPLTRGKALIYRVLAHIEEIKVSPSSEKFSSSLLQKIPAVRSNGMSLIISDFLEDPEGLFVALNSLQAKRQEIRLVQLLHPEERDPEYFGDLKLTDVETDEERDVSMSGKVAERYRETLQKHLDIIESFCRTRGIDFLSLSTSETLKNMIFFKLMSNGWII